MRRTITAMLGVALGAGMASGAIPTSETFDGMSVGQTFVTATNGWQADTNTIVVTNAPAQGGTRSVDVHMGTLSNNVNVVSPPSVVWTEYSMIPTLSGKLGTLPTNTASHIHYFDTNGIMNVATRVGFVAITNDIQRQALGAISTSTYSRITVYQDFSTSNSAVLVNGTVVVQDVAFPGTSVQYRRFSFQNRDGDPSYLDTFSASTTVPASGDGNGNGVADAQELQDNGYVGRILTVGGGGDFADLAVAAAWAQLRDQDILVVTNVSGMLGSGATVSFSNSVTLRGVAFTNNGAIVVAAGKTLTLTGPWLEADALTVSGTVSVATGAYANFDSATFGSGGVVTSTGGRWSVDAPVVDLSGTFTITAAQWNNPLQTSSLDFTDDFESYAVGMAISNLWFRGWGASESGSTVVSSPVWEGVRAASVVGMVSNRVNGGSAPKVWTDFRVQPTRGNDVVEFINTNTATFAAYVASNGAPTYYDNGWHTISNNIMLREFSPLSTGTYARVTVFVNYGTHKAALFLNNTLLVERISVPLTASAYSLLTLINRNYQSPASLDRVQITTLPPADLTGDIEGDHQVDALEIHALDTIDPFLRGSAFLFR